MAILSRLLARSAARGISGLSGKVQRLPPPRTDLRGTTALTPVDTPVGRELESLRYRQEPLPDETLPSTPEPTSPPPIGTDPEQISRVELLTGEPMAAPSLITPIETPPIRAEIDVVPPVRTEMDVVPPVRAEMDKLVPSQAITSEKTSRKQVSAIFKNKLFDEPSGSRNLDIGGGKYNLGSDWLKENKGISNFIFDPYNRSKKHNAAVLKEFETELADSVTAANVLNVIKEKLSRAKVIEDSFKYLKDGKKAYFQIYEGYGKEAGSGIGRETTDGWQNYKKTIEYTEEIEEVFGKGNVERKGNTLIAKKPSSEASRMARSEEQGFTKEVYYHGTRSDFTEFEKGDIGFHVGTSEQANNRLKLTRDVFGEEGENIIPVRINIKNALELSDVGEWNDPEIVANQILEYTKYDFNRTSGGVFGTKHTDALLEIAAEAKELKRTYEDNDVWKASYDAEQLLDEIRGLIEGDGYDSIKYINKAENKFGDRPGFTTKGQKEFDRLDKERHELQNKIGRRKPISPMPERGASEAEVEQWLEKSSKHKHAQPTATEEKRLKNIAEEQENLLETDTHSPYSYIIFDPSKIRSKHAKFNPEKTESADLRAAEGGVVDMRDGGRVRMKSGGDTSKLPDVTMGLDPANPFKNIDLEIPEERRYDDELTNKYFQDLFSKELTELKDQQKRRQAGQELADTEKAFFLESEGSTEALKYVWDVTDKHRMKKLSSPHIAKDPTYLFPSGYSGEFSPTTKKIYVAPKRDYRAKGDERIRSDYPTPKKARRTEQHEGIHAFLDMLKHAVGNKDLLSTFSKEEQIKLYKFMDHLQANLGDKKIWDENAVEHAIMNMRTGWSRKPLHPDTPVGKEAHLLHVGKRGVDYETSPLRRRPQDLMGPRQHGTEFIRDTETYPPRGDKPKGVGRATTINNIAKMFNKASVATAKNIKIHDDFRKQWVNAGKIPWRKTNIFRQKVEELSRPKDEYMDTKSKGGKVGAIAVAASLMANGGQAMDMRDGGMVSMKDGGWLERASKMYSKAGDVLSDVADDPSKWASAALGELFDKERFSGQPLLSSYDLPQAELGKLSEQTLSQKHFGDTNRYREIWSLHHGSDPNLPAEIQYTLHQNMAGNAPEQTRIDEIIKNTIPDFEGDVGPFKKDPEISINILSNALQRIAYHESLGGKFKRQQVEKTKENPSGLGPARGWWQIQPDTARSMLENEAKDKGFLGKRVKQRLKNVTKMPDIASILKLNDKDFNYLLENNQRFNATIAALNILTKAAQRGKLDLFRD